MVGALGEHQVESLGWPELVSAVARVREGLPAADLSRVFRDCRPAARITNRAGVANEEAGLPITLCRELRGTWAEHWPQLVHLG